MGSFQGREADWLGVHEALRRILRVEPGAGHEDVPLSEALGRTLAEPITARAHLPPWDNSAMDGYAARAEDIRRAAPGAPVRLTVVGRVRAGEALDTPLEPGQAVRIMTGAPVPPGADSVVRVEDTDAEHTTPGHVDVRAARDAGRNIRPGGRDMQRGDVVLEAGTPIGPGAVAVLAAAGWPRAPVATRPRVAIVTTGDELASLEDYARVVAAEAVPESNGPMLAAAVRVCGGEPVLLPRAPDDPVLLRRTLDDALGVGREDAPPPDLLLTVGGASMGEADLLKDVLEEMGMALDFWRVRIRPGSPLSLGWLPGDVPVLSLPGNPASAFVTFNLFARPLLRRLMGSPTPHLPAVRAVAGERLHSVEHLCHFHRVSLDPTRDGSARAYLTGPQGSGLVTGLAGAEALAVVPEGVTEIASGAPVTCLRLDAPLSGRADPGYAEVG